MWWLCQVRLPPWTVPALLALLILLPEVCVVIRVQGQAPEKTCWPHQMKKKSLISLSKTQCSAVQRVGGQMAAG